MEYTLCVSYHARPWGHIVGKKALLNLLYLCTSIMLYSQVIKNAIDE